MAIYFIRHASAGDRSRWGGGSDWERPLDDKGRAQAEALRNYFADRSIRRIGSSSAVRCLQTIAPTARQAGIDIEELDELAEGATPASTAGLLLDVAFGKGDVVLCSHGDVIPETLSELLREGMVVRGKSGCEKGSMWELEVRGRDIVAADYHSAAEMLSAMDPASP